MATTTNLTTLKINYLTQAQYDALVQAGTVNADEIYLTPENGSVTETDPVFTASVAHGITADDVQRWNVNSQIDFGNSNFYPIISIDKVTYSGVSGVVVSYDDGSIDGGTLFFADGNGLTTVKTAIEAEIPTVPTNVSAFTNDAGYLTSYTETDPTVPAWAKASSKPTYTASEVGALPDTTAIPEATTAINDSGYLYNGQTVDAKISGAGFSTSNNLLSTTSDTYVALRANSSNPFLGLKCGTNLWYAQASGAYFYFGPTSAKAMRLDQNGNALFVGTVQANDDLTLYTPSGNSPGIIFQRGTLTDNYNDWKIYDKGGYLYFAQRGSGSSDFGDIGYIDTGGVLRNFTIPWSSITGEPTIPTKTSDLTNDSGYITASQVPTELPVVTSSDNGKVLRVVNGAWSAVALPSASGVSF